MFIPTHNVNINFNFNKDNYAKIISDFFNYEIDYILSIHDSWLKFPIIKISDNTYNVYLKSCDNKMNEFCNNFNCIILRCVLIDKNDYNNGKLYKIKFL